MQTCVAIAFSNTLGNLIFLSAAVKILRHWNYEKIDLITDKNFIVNQDRITAAINSYGRFIFDNVKTYYNPNEYDKLFYCQWSMPVCISEYLKKNGIVSTTIDWNKTGVHEVQLYLEMIGASWQDFDGYVFDVCELKSDLPKTNKIRIALANANGTEQASKKQWPHFASFSKELIKIGFEIVLVGLSDELTDCTSTYDFRGKLSIFETGRVLQQCDLLVASSCGLTVVADAVKIPILLIEGPMCTSRAHPLQSKYDIVRKYIQCAPCFQTAFWDKCKVPICMTDIKPSEVIKKLFQFLPKSKNQSYRRIINYNDNFKDTTNESIKNLDKKCIYCTSVHNRYYEFKRFIDSFIQSNPLKGTLLILNDNSYDPRIKSLISELSINNIEIKYFESDLNIIDKKKYKIDSIRVNNFLFEKIKEYKKDTFDYIVCMDSDTIFKLYWLQKSILAFEEAKQKHKIWGVSPLNNLVNYFDKTVTDEKIYENSISKYRLRGGLCINFILPENFIDTFGMYNENASSSDLSKSSELLKKGYKGMVLVPSMIQHIGALYSTFRHRTGVIAEDF